VGAILNVVTDTMILAIPIPMLWKLQVRFSKKLVIGVLLCSGLFVIAAAIIRAVLTLGSTPSGLNINRWGVRETIVGLITVNAPILRPIFNKGFWSKGSFNSCTGEETTAWTSHTSRSKYGKGTFKLRSGVNSTRSARIEGETETASQSSQENIIKRSMDELPYGNGDVMVKTTYHVQSYNRDFEADYAGAQSNNGCQTDVTALHRAI
jgi:hypothetical protein